MWPQRCSAPRNGSRFPAGSSQAGIPPFAGRTVFAALWMLLHPGPWRPSPPSHSDGFIFLSRIAITQKKKKTNRLMHIYFPKKKITRFSLQAAVSCAFLRTAKGAEREDYNQAQHRERLLLPFLPGEGPFKHPLFTSAAPHCLLVAKMH